jgi:PhnB protein
MATQSHVIQPYLFFEGRTEEALDFYKRTIGAQVEMLMRFKDAPADAPRSDDPGCRPPAGAENKVMHCSFKVGDSVVMASDGMCTGKPQFGGFGLSLPAKDEAEVNRLFKALSDGGQVITPVSKTFFSSAFGMVADKFGVMWMIIVPQAMPA